MAVTTLGERAEIEAAGWETVGTALRSSGIDIIGSVAWGSHFCQFYQSAQDLLDILVPYFKAGLENNEFCMWVTAEPVTEEKARQGLRDAGVDADRYLASGQLEIIPHSDWYLKGGAFESDRVLQGWVDKLNAALARGYDGLRLTGNTFWLEKSDWRSFSDYERAVDNVIDRYRMVALCTYQVDHCGVSEVADVISNHRFALIKRQGGWEIIESAERRRAEEERERLLREVDAQRQLFQAVVEHAPAGIAVLRAPDLICEVVNPAFQAFAPGKTMQGRRFMEVWSEVAAEIEPLIDHVLRTGETYRAFDVPFNIERAPGGPLEQAYFTFAYVRLCLQDGRSDALLVLATETTPQVLARGKLQELAAETQRQAAAAERRAMELDAAYKELESFSYSVSHDLRAPLRGIDGFSQALLEDYSERLDDRGKDYLQRLSQASQRMGQLIDGLLALSRTTRSQMCREQVDLSALARATAGELQRTDPGRRVEFSIAPGLLANGDTRLLQVVLENLLSNAWKFTGKQPTASIEFGIGQRDGQPAYFVRDDGAGFDMAYSDKLFGAFQRLHASSEFGGTGIGLATVQRIVHRHGGRVWAEGAVGQGASFWFTLGQERAASVE